MRFLSRALLVALLLMPATLVAQTGRIIGTVTDSARVPLASATVTILNTRLGAISDDQGQYVIVNVEPGTYQMRFQRIGERAEIVSNVIVRAGEATRVDVMLARAPLTLAGLGPLRWPFPDAFI